MHTLPRKRPERMNRNGRPADQEFRPEELLYRRYIQEHFENGKIVDAHFSFPPSTNRQKFSEPEDVLFSEDGRFDSCGVLEFETVAIPVEVEDDQGTIFVFFPRHVPEETNYSHAEVWCERAQQRGNQALPSSTAKKKFRAKLSQHVKVRIQAIR
jgi:hypothetical protein